MKRFEIAGIDLSKETVLDNDKYSCIITVWISDLELLIPNFCKQFEVISDNSMTGKEVDTQREGVANDYINLINK